MNAGFMTSRISKMILVAAAMLFTGSHRAVAQEIWMTPMKEFTSGFRSLEQVVRSKNLAKVAEHADRITRQSKLLAELQNSISPDQRASFATHVNTLHDLSSQLSQTAASGDNRHIDWYVNEIRNTCVSCHAGFRDLDNLAGFYPAKGNTVIADVSIFTADGQPKPDNSGAIVFIDGLIKPADDANQPRPVVSQQNRQFTPQVLPIVRGTTVDFPNDDSILHNVFSLSKTRRFDLDVYQPGKSKSVKFSKPGLVRLYCNIHPEMTCSILVLNNPYFSTTGASGRCIISGIPDGTFNVRTWQQLGGESRQSVTLSGASVMQVPLNVREAKRSLAHRNKYGQKYSKQGKYK
jgi:plastocyanin